MPVSIIIPACQEEKYIESTLKSIPKGHEIIVVCNGCTDSTPSIAKKHSKVYELRQRNVSKARNFGAKKASNQDLIFLDADTQLTSKCMEIIELKLKESIVGTCKSVPDKNKLKYKLIMAFKNLFLWTHWTSGIIFCKKEIFEKVNGFNESLTKKEDRDFVNKCLKYGKFGIADCYVINSMRRYENKGIFSHAIFWIKETLKPTKKDYEIIR